MSQHPHVLIAGLGSPHGDDQAGWLVVEKLASQCQRDSDIMVRRASIPLDLLDWMVGVDVLHICDACESTETQVTLHRFTYRAETDIPHSPLNLNSLRSRGTHDFGLPEVLRLAEATNLLPERIIIWALPGTSFLPESALSLKIQVAAMEAANAIQRELRLTHA